MKKIMFSDRLGLTQAVLEGRKTMTRRLVKDANLLQWLHEMEVAEYVIKGTILDEYSKYKVGEVVAVAQAYKDCDYNPMFIQQAFVKKPTIFPELDKYSPMCGYVDLPLKYHKGWANKMFVFPIFMPHQIKVTNIKVERLKDISDEDCMKEGILEKYHAPGVRNFYYVPPTTEVTRKEDVHITPQEAFARLIDKISGKGTWERNPWVFVYEFELVKGDKQ